MKSTRPECLGLAGSVRGEKASSIMGNQLDGEEVRCERRPRNYFRKLAQEAHQQGKRRPQRDEKSIIPQRA